MLAGGGEQDWITHAGKAHLAKRDKVSETDEVTKCTLKLVHQISPDKFMMRRLISCKEIKMVLRRVSLP